MGVEDPSEEFSVFMSFLKARMSCVSGGSSGDIPYHYNELREFGREEGKEGGREGGRGGGRGGGREGGREGRGGEGRGGEEGSKLTDQCTSLLTEDTYLVESGSYDGTSDSTRHLYAVFTAPE